MRSIHIDYTCRLSLLGNRFPVILTAMVIVAELVSTVKKTLARALVVVVSVGFGLIKPRLGPTLHKLIAVCFIYFVLSAVEGCLGAMKVCRFWFRVDQYSTSSHNLQIILFLAVKTRPH